MSKGRGKGKSSKRGKKSSKRKTAVHASWLEGKSAKRGKARRPGPTMKAKKAYYGLLVKSYKRLKPIMQKYHPELV